MTLFKCDLDNKLSRQEMACIEERWESKMRCLATCLEALHQEYAGGQKQSAAPPADS